MILWLMDYLSQWYHGFQVFHYLTLRMILATLTSLLISLQLGPVVIRWLRAKQLGQQIRVDGPKSHYDKAGTPTMGGVLVLVAAIVSTLLWCHWSNVYIGLVLVVTVCFGLIGWVDDYRKIIQKNSKGLSSRAKFFWQSIVGLAVACTLYWFASTPQETMLFFPFIKTWAMPLGAFFIFFSYLVIVGTSNAVNLTDGLDGLAILPTVMITAALGIFAYVTGHMNFAEYLGMPFVPGVGELVVFCGALIGAGLGFLWFNAYPAMIFMGDVGSLALGGALGTIAVIVRQELVLFIMGGVFVLETVSVMLQVASFKLRGKRIFRMAPIHHHFELLGWPEPRIIVRFWILTVIFVLIGLSTLKIR